MFRDWRLILESLVEPMSASPADCVMNICSKNVNTATITTGLSLQNVGPEENVGGESTSEKKKKKKTRKKLIKIKFKSSRCIDLHVICFVRVAGDEEASEQPMTEKELLCFLLVIFKHVRNLGANTTSPFKLHLNKAEYRKISSTERTTEINLGWPRYSGTIESIFLRNQDERKIYPGKGITVQKKKKRN